MREITFVWKGQNCMTEMYSALRAEVPNIVGIWIRRRG